MWKIQEARLKKHLTQEQLAELVGLSVSYVCEIENGRKNPSLKTLKKISSVLNIPLSSVFSEEPLSKNDASFCCPFSDCIVPPLKALQSLPQWRWAAAFSSCPQRKGRNC